MTAADYQEAADVMLAQARLVRAALACVLVGQGCPDDVDAVTVAALARFPRGPRWPDLVAQHASRKLHERGWLRSEEVPTARALARVALERWVASRSPAPA